MSTVPIRNYKVHFPTTQLECQAMVLETCLDLVNCKLCNHSVNHQEFDWILPLVAKQHFLKLYCQTVAEVLLLQLQSLFQCSLFHFEVLGAFSAALSALHVIIYW